MPYSVRNSIILIVLLVLFSGAGGTYIYWYQKKEIKKIEQERKKIHAQLGDVQNLYFKFEELTRQVAALNESWKLRPKTIPTYESATNTHHYLNTILALSPEMDLNVQTADQVNQNGCGYIRYHLAGQGPFHSLHRFLEYLEYGPRLMKLTNVDTREVHTVDEKHGEIVHTVQFDADLLAYFSEQQPFKDPSAAPEFSDIHLVDLKSNPFFSLVNPEIPPNAYDLPDVEQSTLLAVMKDRAFISDQHNELVMLTEGDEVYLGYVSKIMPERRQVLFILNKGGIVERYVLTVRFENQLQGLTK